MSNENIDDARIATAKSRLHAALASHQIGWADEVKLVVEDHDAKVYELQWCHQKIRELQGGLEG